MTRAPYVFGTLSFHYIGCVGLLLETISPFLEGSSPILNHALRIVELLGAYRFVTSHEIPLCFIAAISSCCFAVHGYSFLVQVVFIRAKASCEIYSYAESEAFRSSFC